MANRWGKNENSDRFCFLELQNHCGQWLQSWNSKMPAPWKESYNTPRQHIKKQRHLSANKSPYSQIYGFPITSWQIDGETMATVTDFIFLGSQITADGDCLLLGRKAMTNLSSILKSRDITLPTKVHLVKATVFPVVMYGCDSWAIKKTEPWRIDSFELWCWRRLLRVSWTAGRSNQSILKEINPEYSLEGLILKLKLQYFGYLMRRANSLEKTLILGKTECRRRGGNRG